MCISNKTNYATRKAAKSARSVLELKYEKHYMIYLCECGMFHLATKKNEKSKERGDLQRSCANYGRFVCVSDKIDILVRYERRGATRSPKACKSNRKRKIENKHTRDERQDDYEYTT
jgi:hypothetical protein